LSGLINTNPFPTKCHTAPTPPATLPATAAANLAPPAPPRPAAETDARASRMASSRQRASALSSAARNGRARSASPPRQVGDGADANVVYSDAHRAVTQPSGWTGPRSTARPGAGVGASVVVGVDVGWDASAATDAKGDDARRAMPRTAAIFSERDRGEGALRAGRELGVEAEEVDGAASWSQAATRARIAGEADAEAEVGLGVEADVEAEVVAESGEEEAGEEEEEEEEEGKGEGDGEGDGEEDARLRRGLLLGGCAGAGAERDIVGSGITNAGGGDGAEEAARTADELAVESIWGAAEASRGVGMDWRRRRNV
jgi:hypothetical protein